VTEPQWLGTQEGVPVPGRRTLRAAAGPDEQLAGLTARVAAGDLAAFERLYDRLAPAVHGVATRVVRDPARAEEVTQEVFLEVWQQAARYARGRGGVRTWVLTIAHRRAVDAVRASEASRVREQHVARREPTVAPGPEGAVLAEAERASVRRCLESLTPLQLESVRLAYYEGYTYPQVAEVLDRPLPTIKTRMRDGLIRLRDCLEAGDER